MIATRSNESRAVGSAAPRSAAVAAVLSRLEGVRSSGKDQWEARCPAHDDRSPSLSVGVGRDGRALLTCHTGCSLEAITAALGMEPRDLFPREEEPPRAPAAETRTHGRIVATYAYYDEAGELLYEVVRYAPKDFRQRRPDGRGGWSWSVKEVRKVPYRLPEVIAAVQTGRTVFVVEGEKDADRLAALGLVATCNAGGAKKWTAELSEPLHGARVVVVPDNDVPGREHAELVVKLLKGVAAEIRVLEFPELGPVREKHGEDVSDWLDLGHTAEELKVLARAAEPVDDADEETKPAFPAPMSIGELLQLEEPEEQWLFEGAIPLDANVLIGGYPKSHKTNFLLEIGVSGGSGTPFLGRYRAARRFRVGLVLMEDRAHRIRRRLSRICQAHGVSLRDLEGWLYLWFRPPLRLSHAPTMAGVAEWVKTCQLDALFVDNWSLVSEGDSDKADQVTPQLDRLTGLRSDRQLTVGLVHHARKSTKEVVDGERLTDMMRNSSAFGAWYDAGYALIRRGENAPVTVRTELRDAPTEPFAFIVEDEFPASPAHGPYPSGALRLLASDRSAERIQQEATAAKYRPLVIEFLRENPGCSKRDLRKIQGDNTHVEAAFQSLQEDGLARFDAPEKRGAAGRCWLTLKGEREGCADRAGSVLAARSGGGVLTVLEPPVGGRHAAHSDATQHGDDVQHGPEPLAKAAGAEGEVF